MKIFSDYLFESIEPILAKTDLIYNPYPRLGAPQSPCWPRGFPLENILESTKSNTEERLLKSDKSKAKFGILQSLADI